jgi:hypothetical protein
MSHPQDLAGGEPVSVSGKVVVLSGGALGSPEILLRAKAAGLSLSDQVLAAWLP